MNLDTLSYMHAIRSAAKRVQTADIGGGWILIGYVQGDEGAKKLNLMTINVIKEGSIWKDLVTSFEDDQIMYGYAKLNFEACGDGKIFLIHWVGSNVGENEKSSCMPHLNEVRNLLPSYDHIINSMNPLDIQSKVHNYLTIAMPIEVDNPLLSRSSRITSLKMRPSGRSSSVDWQEMAFGPFNRTRTFGDKLLLDSSLERRDSHKIDSTDINTMTANIYRIKLPKFKVAILGDAAVGKTSIYQSYKDGGNALTSPTNITTYADCMRKKVAVEQHVFNLEIWDTAGMERYMAFASTWTRNAKVVVTVYDITDIDTFKNVSRWLALAQQFADPRAIYVLVGNKADLVGRRVVTEAAAEKFASEQGMIFIECSGLTGYNILNLFEHISRMVIIIYPELLETNIIREHSNSTIHLPVGTDTSSQLSTKLQKRHGCNQCSK